MLGVVRLMERNRLVPKPLLSINEKRSLEVARYLRASTRDGYNGKDEDTLWLGAADLFQVLIRDLQDVVRPDHVRVYENEGYIRLFQTLEPEERGSAGIEKSKLSQMLEAVEAPGKGEKLSFVDIDWAERLGFNGHATYRRKSRSVGRMIRAVTPRAAW